MMYCWEDGPLTDDGCPTSCTLPDAHSGPHEWTRADKISFSMAKELLD